MIQFNGITTCSCGQKFKWVATKPEKGEFVFGEIDKQNQNVLIVEKISDSYHITLKCPRCNKKVFLIKSNTTD